MTSLTGLELVPIPPGRVLLSDRRLQRRWQVDLPAFRLAAVAVTTNLLYGDASHPPEHPGAGRLAYGDDSHPPEHPGFGRLVCGDGSQPPEHPGAGRLVCGDGSQPPEHPGADLAEAGAGPVELGPQRPGQAAEAGRAGLRPGPVDRVGRLPAVNVSWWEAVRFCNTLSERAGLTPPYQIDGESVTWDEEADGYRLPTEAEWEHACRAGTVGPRYGDLNEIAWYRANSDGRLHESGEKRPNAWGLHDMLGNTWDWCWDVYDAEAYGPYRVLRGGGWFDEHWSCRASVRRRSHPTFRVDDVSFRLARSG